MNFLMVIMDSGIARGRVHTTTTATESLKMAAILQVIGLTETYSLGLPFTDRAENDCACVTYDPVGGVVGGKISTQATNS